MEQRGRYDSIISLLGVFAIAVALIGSLALLATWLAGNPAQAATSSLDPTPTAYIPQATAQPTAGLPTATPLAPTQVPPTAAPATVVAGTDGVNVRSGPGTDFAKIGLLAPGAEARVIGRHGDWWQIEYEGMSAWVASWVVTAFNVEDVPEVTAPPTPVPASPAEIPPPAEPWEIDEVRWIDVDLSEQTLTAYENGVPVHTTLVSTGLPKTPTPTGQFRIWIKFRYDDMAGEDYYIEDVPYVMYFYQGYGLHGVTWHGNFGHPMSHGCVNLPTEEAEWLFNWADVGTLVNIHD
jgi:lipoprotein-anchoring transpeptidase ErfK/SrfK